MRALAFPLLGLALLTGCAFMRPARGALSTRRFVEHGPTAARGVVVLLPGYGDRPADFDNEGFVERLAAHAPGYDLVGVDLHFNYYRKGRALRRLEQVVAPLRAQGYREVWLLGVSMGGLGAVLYAQAHPEQLTGLWLFAPYWGRGDVAADVAAAPSLCDWDAQGLDGEALSEEGRAYLGNWRFLQAVGCEPTTALPVWVGYGRDDPPSAAGQQFVDRLPADHVTRVAGGHGWKAWASLVDAMAPRVLPRRPPTAAPGEGSGAPH